MKWAEYGQLLFDELQALARPVPREFARGLAGDALFELFADLDREYAQTLEAAIQTRAATGRWPAMPDGENYFLLMRMYCAVDTVNILLAGDWPRPLIPLNPSGKSDFGRVLNWLLIETWKWRFDLWLKMEALRFWGPPDSFYGLGGAAKP